MKAVWRSWLLLWWSATPFWFALLLIGLSLLANLSADRPQELHTMDWKLAGIGVLSMALIAKQQFLMTFWNRRLTLVPHFRRHQFLAALMYVISIASVGSMGVEFINWMWPAANSSSAWLLFTPLLVCTSVLFLNLPLLLLTVLAIRIFAYELPLFEGHATLWLSATSLLWLYYAMRWLRPHFPGPWTVRLPKAWLKYAFNQRRHFSPTQPHNALLTSAATMKAWLICSLALATIVTTLQLLGLMEGLTPTHPDIRYFVAFIYWLAHFSVSNLFVTRSRKLWLRCHYRPQIFRHCENLAWHHARFSLLALLVISALGSLITGHSLPLALSNVALMTVASALGIYSGLNKLNRIENKWWQWLSMEALCWIPFVWLLNDPSAHLSILIPTGIAIALSVRIVAAYRWQHIDWMQVRRM